jgi:hypothetical protein
MSHYIVKEGRFKYVFGWDQPLQSFFLQVHDSKIVDPENNPVHWIGTTQDTKLYEVEDLYRSAHIHGLHIPYETQIKLYGDKDAGI